MGAVLKGRSRRGRRMENNNTNWEELVDLYVDEECSSEERLAVEAELERDDSLRSSVESALRIRKGLAELRVDAPKELDGRLRRALTSATRGISARRRASSVARALRSPGVALSSAALIAVAVGAVASRRGSTEIAPLVPGSRQIVEERSFEGSAPSDASVNFVRIPLSEGTASASVLKRDSQDAFWMVATVSEDQLEKQTIGFQRVCDKHNVSFTKSGNDREYLLREARTQTWNQIVGELTDVGEIVESDALRSWREHEDKEARDVRVVFKTVERGAKAGSGESAEE